MNLPFFISRRYLFAKKSHNVINLVSYISLVGVMFGTAALIIVLSAFNGFENLTRSLYGIFDPGFKVTVTEGKTFDIDSAKIVRIASLQGITSVSVTLEENVLIKYEDRQALAVMKGVDAVYEQVTPLHNTMYMGLFTLNNQGYPLAIPGSDIASKLGLYALHVEPLLFYVPKRGEKVSLTNPSEALDVLPIYAAGIFAVETSFDSKYVFVPIEFARELLSYGNRRAGALEIGVDSLADNVRLKREIESIMGPDMTVKNRYEQNTALYKMMKSEKAVIYLIVLFVAVILSFNVLSSLLLLMIEKKKDMETFRSMGASLKLTRRIFMSEGMLISLSGMFAGLLLGLTLCLLQQHLGFLKLPGDSLIIDSYPVTVQLPDILLVIISVSVIGFIASWVSAKGVNRILKD